MKPHLLLTSLGESPGAVFALLVLLHKQGTPVTELWVATTDHDNINCHFGDHRRELEDSPDFTQLTVRFFVVEGVCDIVDNRTHRTMSEVLFRLALRGVDWARAQSPVAGTFSVGIAGGRKTMSSMLQQAAVFFPIHAVYHAVYAGEEKDVRTLDDVEHHLDKHYLIPIASQPSPWNTVLKGPWEQSHSATPLRGESFPLQEIDEGDHVRVTAQSEPRLFDLLERIATLTAVFTSPQALAAGLGSQLLQHDLRDYLTSIPKSPAIATLNGYLLGLRRLLQGGAAIDAMRWREIREICHDGFVLAVGEYREGLDYPGELSVCLDIDPDTETQISTGLDRNLLVVILRNLFANVKVHGHKRSGPIATVRLCLDEDRQLICLEVRNRADDSTAMIERVERADLLKPGEKGPTSNGEGLGLFGVDHALRRVAGARLEGPYFEGSPREFFLRMHFPCSQEAP